MKNKKVYKYTNQYMALGMCLGISLGMTLGASIFDNIGTGMCMGLAIGIGIGISLGAAKDKKLSENLVEITAIEETEGSDDVLVRATDKNGGEKQYTVKKKTVQSEKLSVGSTAAEDDGTLTSIQ